jgi:hypothetical protein
LDDLELVIVEKHQATIVFGVRKVAFALGSLLFYKIAEHEDGLDLVLVDHSPEILEGRGQWALRRDNPLALDGNEVSVDIILNCFILGRGV